jgi:hypothetical protein
LAALEDDLRVKTSAVASGDGGITKTMPVAEEQEGFGTKIFQRKIAAGG